MVTHKGASADSGEALTMSRSNYVGHYIGWTRKDDTIAPLGEEEWYKFDGQ